MFQYNETNFKSMGKKPQFDEKELPINKTCFNMMNQTSNQWKHTSNRWNKLQFDGNKAQTNGKNSFQWNKSLEDETYINLMEIKLESMNQTSIQWKQTYIQWNILQNDGNTTWINETYLNSMGTYFHSMKHTSIW